MLTPHCGSGDHQREVEGFTGAGGSDWQKSGIFSFAGSLTLIASHARQRTPCLPCFEAFTASRAVAEGVNGEEVEVCGGGNIQTRALIGQPYNNSHLTSCG